MEQDWKGMDGAIAFHLIDRHAEDWAHSGKMMREWREANESDDLETLRQRVQELESQNIELQMNLADTEALELGTGEVLERTRLRIAELERFHELDTKQIAYLLDERNNLTAERDELLAALEFARQGYQASSENGDHDEVEWAEMYLRSIDVAIASVKEK